MHHERFKPLVTSLHPVRVRQQLRNPVIWRFYTTAIRVSAIHAQRKASNRT